MTNKKSTKRALLSSILAMVLCCSMLIGTTFAWFTDSVTSKGNIIKTGTLNVEMYYANGENAVPAADSTDWKNAQDVAIFNYDKWEPGYTDAKHLMISNEGTLGLKYQLAIIPTGEVSELAEVIDVYYISPAAQVTGRTALPTKVGTLADVISKGIVQGTLAAGNDYTATIVLKMQEDAGNEYQNLSVGDSFTIQLLATQMVDENDSFDNTYDKDAWVSGMQVYTASDLQAAINAGENVTLMDDITLDAPIVIPASATTFSMRSATPATVIDLNGKTITGNVGRDADGNRVHVIVNNGNAVIKNGVITSAGVNGGSAIYNADGATLTVENVTLNGAPQEGSTWPSYTVNNYGTLTVSDSSIYGVQGIIATNNTANTTVNNVIAYRDGWSSGHVFYNSSTAKVTINGGTYTNDGNGVDGTMIYGGETVVNGGTFIVKEGAYFALCSGSKLTVNGGDFSNIKSCIAWGGAMTISGGTFGFNPTTYVADGYEAKANADGTWTVAMKEGTLNDLFTNVEDNGTVTLPQGTYTIPATVAGKTVTIEGVGDNTVIDFTKVNSVGGASITFKNLHIQGKNENVMNGFGIQSTTGHITYENCTFDGAVTNEYYGSVSYIKCTFTGTGYITTYAVKSAEFVNCTFDKADSRAVLVYSHGDNPCEVTLTDCTFKAAAKATTWAGDWTAAIEVDTTNIPTVGTTVAINNCTYDGNYSGLVRDKSAEGKANAVITVDGKTLLTSDNIKAVTLTSNTGYMLTGDFGGQNVSLVMPAGVENVIFDGSKATNINELIIVQNGKIIDNANDPIGERSGNVTVQNFNVLSQINVFACKTEVVVQNNTAEALMIHAGNCDVKVLNNTIDANFESHPTYRNETATWNNNDYGIALNIFEYNLWLDGNTVTNSKSHAIGINGWEGTFDTGVDNVIESFKDNTITVNSTVKTDRAAFKVWDDETYASNDDATDVVNDTAKAFIAAVLADGSNTFNIVDGYDHTIFCFYNVNTNN